MKKISFLTLAAASLVMVSCSNDADFEGVVPDGTPVQVNFTAEIPADLGSRTYGDGTTASALKYVVYSKADAKLFEGIGDFAGTTTCNVPMTLVTGETYKIYFWAQSSAAPYSFNTETLDVTATYGTDTPNNWEALDAFYTVKEYTVSASDLNPCATLTRATAQLNIATGDKSTVDNLGKYPVQSSVTLTNVPTVLNLKSGEVSSETTITLASANLPTGQITVGGTPYDYLSMSYILAPLNGGVLNTVTMKVDSYSNEEFPYTNIPVKRNYKTNIVGDLLTAKTQWTVKIDPIFTLPSFDNVAVTSTPAAFLEALKSPIMEKIIVTQNLNLSGVSTEELTYTVDKTIVLENNATIYLSQEAHFSSVGSNLTIEGGTITNVDEDGNPIESTRATDMTRKAKSLIEIKSGNLTLKGVKLINDPNHHWHGSTTNSTAIAYWGNCDIVIENSNILSGEFTVCGMGRGGVNTSYVYLKDSYFESTSSSLDNGSHWAYCMRLFGTRGGVIENCEVKGIHGALTTEEGSFTIKGGKYYTVNTPGKTDAFYALYITSDSKVIIEDGDFYAPNVHTGLNIGGSSCISVGDNDTGKPLGHLIDIKGGHFSGKAYNHNTNTVYDFNWVEYTDPNNDLLKWTVAPTE